MRTDRIAMLALALVMGVGARDLPVPAGKGWQHAATGLILSATLDGMTRTRLSDTTQDEWDVEAGFADADGAVIATVYIYHPALDDVAMWFERARVQIQERDVYGGVEALTAEPVAFLPPGATGAPSALRQTFRAGRAFRSTALAVMPLGEWLVAVRLSARKLDAGALDQRLTRILAAIRWPSPQPAAPPLRPIEACPTALAFEKARQVKPQGSDLLMTLLGGAIARDARAKADVKPITWCRDPASTRMRGVYRPVGGGGYLIALQDAGRTMGVWPSIAAQLGEKNAPGWSVSLNDVDGRTLALPSFDRLPDPDQAMGALHGGALGSTGGRGADGKQTITIDPKAL